MTLSDVFFSTFKNIKFPYEGKFNYIINLKEQIKAVEKVIYNIWILWLGKIYFICINKSINEVNLV